MLQQSYHFNDAGHEADLLYRSHFLFVIDFKAGISGLCSVFMHLHFLSVCLIHKSRKQKKALDKHAFRNIVHAFINSSVLNFSDIEAFAKHCKLSSLIEPNIFNDICIHSQSYINI